MDESMFLGPMMDAMEASDANLTLASIPMPINSSIVDTNETLFNPIIASLASNSTPAPLDPFCYQFLPRTAPLPYFGDQFFSFMLFYLPIHKTVIYPVIIFGLISNSMLMIVLAQKKMISPSNTFLIGISIFDVTTLIIYAFMAVPMIKFEGLSFEWNFWFVVLLSPYLIFRSVSTWITVFLALWRVISLYCPFQTLMKLDIANAMKSIIFSTFISILAITPHYTTFCVKHSQCEVNGTARDFYYLGNKPQKLTGIAAATDSIFMQFVPCFVLMIMTGMLIFKLKESAKRRAALRRPSNQTPSEITNPTISGDGPLSKSIQTEDGAKNKDGAKGRSADDQTSNALLAIVILFLTCEVPIACTLLASLFDYNIFIHVVLKTYHLAHLLRLLNASLNFILYCIMSSLFRTTFVEIFSPYVPIIVKRLFCASDATSMETPSGVSSKATDSIEISAQSSRPVISKQTDV